MNWWRAVLVLLCLPLLLAWIAIEILFDWTDPPPTDFFKGGRYP